MKPIFIAPLIAILLIFVGCSKAKDDKTKTFTVLGYIERIENDGSRIVIDHEEMPGYMPAMIMPFKVKDPSESDDLSSGDQIRFTYVVEPTRSWIESIEKTGLKRETKIESDNVASSSILKPNDLLPDYTFLDQENREVRLSDYRGQPVAITFVFTRCPVPEYCPAMMRNFGTVEKMLSADPSAPDSWQLLTISFDPEYDTPEVMKRYGNAFGKRSENWSLLTSTSLEPIEGIAKNIGLKFGKKDDSYLHNLRTIVLDPDGRITKIFTDESWSPEELVQEIIRVGK